MAKEQSFIGYSTNFNDICLVYPPLIKEIISIGYDKFNIYTNLLIKSQEDIEDEFPDKTAEEQPSPFNLMMFMSVLSPEVKETYEAAVSFFVHEKVKILFEIPAILIGDELEKRLITAEIFFDFQNKIRDAIGVKALEDDSKETDPKIRRFKMLQRKRDKVKAKQSGNNAKQFITLLTSACCLGVGLNPLNIGDITFSALQDLITRYTMKDNYDIKIATALAGAGDNKDDSYWIKDVDL